MHTLRHFMVASLLLLSCTATSAVAQDTPTKSGDAAPDMTGHWGQLQVTTSVSDIPVVGDVTSVTRSLLIMHAKPVAGKPNQYVMTETICDVSIDSESTKIRTFVPRAFQRAASGTKRRVVVRPGKTPGTWDFWTKVKTIVLGANLKNPRRDALPDDEDDPRVVDADRDGKPGLTVQVRGMIDGEIYLAQRGWNELKGTFKGSDDIRGLIRWYTAQSVLDATSMFLSGSPDTKPHPNKNKSYFLMRRLAPNTGCAALKQMTF